MIETRYRFGQSTRRGPLGQLRLGQVLAVVLGAGWAVTAIDVSPSGVGGLMALLGLIAAAVSATVPIGGLATDQWLPLVLSWTLRRAGDTSGRRQARDVPDGTIVALSRGPAASPACAKRCPKPRPPRELGDIRLVEIPYRGRKLGAVSEAGGRRLTLLLVGRAPGFALADEDEQQRRLAVWGEALRSVAGSAVRRIAWVERTVPAQPDGLARWLHQQRDPQVPLDGALGRSYLELMDQSAQAGREHEVLLCVQIDAGRLRRDLEGRREQALVGAAERLAQTLERARVTVDAALTAGGVARALRSCFDPYVHRQLAALRAGGGGDELSEQAAWPTSTREHWDHCQVDGALHATFEIGGWPRADVGPAFLGSMLAPSEHVRSVAVCFEPLDPLSSLRQVEYEITRDETDRQTRLRYGQLETARQRQASEAARGREAELTAGHCEVRLAGFVTVTGVDRDELELACEEVLAQAGRANLELRRLYGQQAQGLTFTLPLCRGLR